MSQITVKELRKICKEKGIKGYSKLKKAELIKLCMSSNPKTPKKPKTPKTRRPIKLPSNIRTSPITPPRREMVCNICLENIDGPKTRPCKKGHIYHQDCLKMWKKIHKGCPSCDFGKKVSFSKMDSFNKPRRRV
jgi:hypothetical protein